MPVERPYYTRRGSGRTDVVFHNELTPPVAVASQLDATQAAALATTLNRYAELVQSLRSEYRRSHARGDALVSCVRALIEAITEFENAPKDLVVGVKLDAVVKECEEVLKVQPTFSTM